MTLEAKTVVTRASAIFEISARGVIVANTGMAGLFQISADQAKYFGVPTGRTALSKRKPTQLRSRCLL